MRFPAFIRPGFVHRTDVQNCGVRLVSDENILPRITLVREETKKT